MSQLNVQQLEVLADKLRVYDVDQCGWEGDPEGPKPKTVIANLTHVVFHLSDVIERKDFSNREVVCDKVAPDAIQYSLRIARWGSLAIEQIIPSEQQRYAYDTATTLGISTSHESYLDLALSSFVRANGTLARQLHDEDHASTKETALTKRSSSLSDTAALLIQCATVQSSRGEFDLTEAFDDRLANLRQRFGISEPTSTMA